MYIIAIFIAIAMAVLGGEAIQISLAASHGNNIRASQRINLDYLNKAEEQYVATQSTSVQNGAGLQSSTAPITSGQAESLCGKQNANYNPAGQGSKNGNTTAGNSNSTTYIAGAGSSVCNFYGTWSVTTTGATDTSTISGNGTEQSANVNVNAGEQRAAATITASIQTQSGSILSTRTRTITIRTLQLAPYVILTDSSDTRDPFVTSTGVIGSQGGQVEGDVSGCDPATGCGADTRIQSYAKCVNGGGVNNAQNSLFTAWCTNQTTYQQATTVNGGTYNQAGTSSTTWQPVNSSVLVPKNWNNGGEANR